MENGRNGGAVSRNRPPELEFKPVFFTIPGLAL
jgi:hypothetical protein